MRWSIMILAKGDEKRRGFSLVELMVVVIVVGILAAAAIPIYRFAMGRAYISEAKAKAQIASWKAEAVLGKITAITVEEPCNYDDYKIIAYVKTDIWYAHPWEGAYASINKDGSWKLDSVNRTPSPEQIGVFLVEKDYRPPPLVENPSKELKFIASSFMSGPPMMKE